MTKWKLVPVEPTLEMVWKAEEDSPEFQHGDPWYGSEPPSEGQIRAIYRAMLEAAPQPPKSEPIAYIEHHKGGDNLVWDNPGGKYSVLYTAPLVMKLSDERILEIAMSDDVSLMEDQGPGVRPRITVHNSIGGVYAFARAIERELLGENE